MRGISEDRALIDAAVAAGIVRRFPSGMHALDYTKGISQTEARRAALANKARMRLPERAAVIATPSEAAALRAEGLTYDQIAARLGTVKSHAWRLVKEAGAES
jgi:hypothetical protein